MHHINARYLVPAFISIPPRSDDMKDEQKEATQTIVKINGSEADLMDLDGDTESEKIIEELEPESCPNEEEYKIDSLFYRICWFCFILGVNFYQQRKLHQKIISIFIVFTNVAINVYFIIRVSLITYQKPFNPDTLATSLAMVTWTLQATLSTLFLAYWQYTSEACKTLKQIYNSHKGVGIHHHRKCLISIVRSFYVVIGFIIIYNVTQMIANFRGNCVGFMDKDIPFIFGPDRRFFLIFQLANLYCMLCWAVALFVFSLLVHSTNYEFHYYNQQVRSITCDHQERTDDALCSYLLKLMKIHHRMTECVNRLDQMFHRYAFIMIATIIPTITFALFMVFRRPQGTELGSRAFDLVYAFPLVAEAVFAFFALTNAPSALHTTIYETKSALCANTHIWFPYRPNVYHSALAFVCHLDQTNLGVSIWGFAIVSKPLVLTTLSVMVTCLALFMQFGDCNNARF